MYVENTTEWGQDPEKAKYKNAGGKGVCVLVTVWNVLESGAASCAMAGANVGRRRGAREILDPLKFRDWRRRRLIISPPT